MPASGHAGVCAGISAHARAYLRGHVLRHVFEHLFKHATIGPVADPRDNKPKMVHVCPGKRPGQANPIGQGRAGKRGGSAGAAPFRIAFVNDGT